jgi:hypothetical protein
MVATVDTSTSAFLVAYSYEKKCFYANGRWWALYSNGTNFGWKTSVDGIDWTGSFTIYGAYGSWTIDIWYDEANNKICLARYAGAYVYYRQGTANGDGTITWDSDEVTVTSEGIYGGIRLCKDSNGYPWVSYITITNYYARVVKATTTNGSSWGTPTTLWTGTSASVIIIVPLTSGKMLALLSKNGAVFQSRLYNGSSWETAVNASTSNPSSYTMFDAVADGDNVHLVFVASNSNIIYVKYLYGTGWGSEETVESATINQYHPSISFKSTDKVRVFYFLSGRTTIKYRDRDSGSWQTAVTISSSESTLTCVSSSYRAFSSKICVTWKSGASSPYDVKFEGYSLEEAIAKSFSEVGAGSEVFGIPFKALPFNDTGHGAEAFNTPFRAIGFSDVGSGLDSFIVLLSKAFADAGVGSDVFTKELIGFIEKAFADSGLGADSFLIPFKAMKFSDSGLGSDVFTIPFKAIIFVDTATGTDVFVIPFKTMSFSDVASGTDVFFLLRELAFSDLGSGADTFAKTILEIISKAFVDAGLGSDVFSAKHIHKVKLPFLIGMTLDGQLVWIFKQEYDVE